MRKPLLKLTFTGEDDFEATHKATGWLSERGYLVGSMQGSAPRAAFLNSEYVSKWKNLNQEEKDSCDARLDSGDPRRGPVHLTVFVMQSEKPKEAA